ncbi:hypothetical protein D3C85_1543470 [compost metagenome]
MQGGAVCVVLEGGLVPTGPQERLIQFQHHRMTVGVVMVAQIGIHLLGGGIGLQELVAHGQGGAVPQRQVGVEQIQLVGIDAITHGHVVVVVAVCDVTVQRSDRELPLTQLHVFDTTTDVGLVPVEEII